MRNTVIAAALAGTAVLTLAACGSGHSTARSSASVPAAATAPTPTAAPAVNYGAEYLAIVTPVNTAGDTFVAKWNALPGTATTAQQDAVLTPILTALQTADGKLAAIQWPTNAEADVKAMIVADGAVQGDLMNLEGGGSSAPFVTDLGKAHAASEVVRGDLGLPQS
jgi:hypothetical protein